MAEYETTAVAFDDLKNAALYFDYLVPVLLGVEVIRDPDWKARLNEKGAMDCLPLELAQRAGFAERFAKLNMATLEQFRAYLRKHHRTSARIPSISVDEYSAIADNAVSEYFRFIDDFGLRDCPIASSEGATSAWMDDADDARPSPVVTMADLKLVDVSAVSWEHILEFREDRQAKDSLRRLRLFAYERYSGQSRAYIEDDLLTRISEYEQTAKQWGFETFLGAISAVLNSKLTASIVAGSFLTTLFAQPRTALLSAAVGAVVEVGHVSIEISRQRFAIQKLARDSAVSFVSYSRAKLDSSSAH